MSSAIAQSNIFPGAAVAQSKDSVSLAGGSLLATHIVITGAPARGVVTMTSNGLITLNDWSLSTGSKQLITNATYYVGGTGQLSTSGTQPIGIAVSPVTLSVAIQTQSGSSSSFASQTTVNNNTNQISTLTSQVQDLQTIVTALTNNISLINTTLSTLLTSVTSNSAAISSLTAQNAQLTSQLAQLSSNQSDQEDILKTIVQTLKDNDLEIPDELDSLL